MFYVLTVQIVVDDPNMPVLTTYYTTKVIHGYKLFLLFFCAYIDT